MKSIEVSVLVVDPKVNVFIDTLPLEYVIVPAVLSTYTLVAPEMYYRLTLPSPSSSKKYCVDASPEI